MPKNDGPIMEQTRFTRLAKIEISKTTFNRPLLRFKELLLIESTVDGTLTDHSGKQVENFDCILLYLVSCINSSSQKVSPCDPFAVRAAGKGLFAP